MPDRLAATSPFKPVAEIVGSGPYRFLPEEHISGARAAYERFPLRTRIGVLHVGRGQRAPKSLPG